VSLCVARKTAGSNYAVITTPPPRADRVRADTNRLTYNALLTSSSWRAAKGIDGVIDFAGQLIIGQSSQSPGKQRR
jgi:hypothetical protein